MKWLLVIAIVVSFDPFFDESADNPEDKWDNIYISELDGTEVIVNSPSETISEDDAEELSSSSAY